MSHKQSDDLDAFSEGFGAALEEFKAKRTQSPQKAHKPAQSIQKPLPSTAKIRRKPTYSPEEKKALELRTNKVLAPKPVYLVKLAVRKRDLSPDELYEHYSMKTSRVEARIEAEKAANADGYPIVGYVYDIVRFN